MPAIPASALGELLREQGHDAIVAFVADLWTASGWDTMAEEVIVTARQGNATHRLLVLPPFRLPWLRSAPAFEGSIDLVVSPHLDSTALPRGTPSAAVAAVEELRNRLLYALDRETGEFLAQKHLGVSPRGDQWEPEDPLVVRLGAAAADTAAPVQQRVSRRAALGVLGVSAIAGSAWLLADNDGDAADDGLPETTGETGSGDAGEVDGFGTFDDPIRANATFAFEAGNELVTISHERGDPIPAGDLVIRSQGVGADAETRWSDVSTRQADDEVVAGDALTLPAAETFEIALFVARDGREQRLAEFSHESETETATDDEGVSTGPPIASFVFLRDPDDDRLTIRHGSGDPIETDTLSLQGAGFSGSPDVRWEQLAGLDDADVVEPGVSAALTEVDRNAVVRVVWTGDTTTSPRVLDTYRGPNRPLDGSLGSLQNDRYDLANTGHAPGSAGPGADVGSLQESWRFDRPGTLGPSIAVVDGRLFVVTLDGPVYALDAVDGTELWRFTTDNRAGWMPAVVGETVFLGTIVSPDGPAGQRSSGACALDVTDGSKRWGTEILRLQPSQIAATTETVYLPASGTGGTDGVVYALNPTTRRPRWTARLDSFSGSIAVGPEAVYTTPGSAVVALDRADGDRRWQFEPEELSGRTVQPMVVDGTDSVVTIQRSGLDSDRGFRVHALDRTDGTVRWERRVDRELAPADGPLRAAAAAGSDRLWFGTDQGLVALGMADGAALWADPGGALPVETFTATDDALYVADTTGSINLRNPASGTRLGTVRTDVERIRSLVATGDRLYAGGDSLLAFEHVDDDAR